MLILWLLFNLTQPSEKVADLNSFWDLQVRGLHRNIQACRWYAAKQNLAHLKWDQPDRYKKQQFVLTEAWIGEQERSWQQVLRAYDDWGEEHPWSFVSYLRAKVGLGQNDQAIAYYLSHQKRFVGRAKWDAQRLYAQALKASEQYDQALKVYRKLSRRQAPRNMRMEAVYYSAAIHYARGELEAGRSLVQNLHESWPGSDEALDGIHLQERSEVPAFFDRFKVWNRFSKVAYANRDFRRARTYFQKIVDGGPNEYQRDRARYFLALIPLKLGEPERGLKAFRDFLDQQEGGRYLGLGAFQYARSLLMMSRDEEAISFSRSYWDATAKPSKWLQNCAKILILALRRSKDVEGFRRLERQLDQKSAGASLRRFYHRNGVVWALQRALPHDANHHLQALKRFHMKRGERQEVKVWQGLIDRDLGRDDQAVKLWLDVVVHDPNHYFGLVAAQLLQVYGNLEERWAGFSKSDNFLDDISDPKKLHQLYHLAPDLQRKHQVGIRLKSFFPNLKAGLDYRVLPSRSKAKAFAEIGRFDWASRSLQPSEVDTKTIQYLKAKWSLSEGQYQRAIIWGEALVRAYPKWTPYELIPEAIQRFIYPEGFAKIVHEKASDFAVDPYLLLAIIREESKFNARAKSVASARGLMQFIPSTANTIANEIEAIQDFSLSQLYEPETSITLGARYVDKLMELFSGGSLQTVAAYNAGELTVARWTSYSDDFHPLHFVWDVAYDETKYYCQKVLRAYYHYARVYDEAFSQKLLQPNHLAPPLIPWSKELKPWQSGQPIATD